MNKVARKTIMVLAGEACSKLGFCGSVQNGKPSHITDYLPDEGVVTSDQFVEWILKAEGMGSIEQDQTHAKGLKALFFKHVGGDMLDI